MIKQSKLFAYVAICSIVLFMSSCLAPAENNDMIEGVTESTVASISASVNVGSPWGITRASNEEVPLPIRYYLFAESGECVGLQLVEDASTSAEFSVTRGVYTLYSLCGNSSSAPSAAEASQDVLYSLSANDDLCLGNKTVTVDKYGVSYPVEISASHIFSMVALSLIGVPESVEEICAVFGDLYSSIKLSGEYGGTDVVSAYLETDDTSEGKWNLPLTYVYPSVGASMPITLTIRSNDGVIQTIETVTEYVAKEGMKVSLTAEFQALSSVTTGGVVIENGWTETSGNIEFWSDNENNADNNVEIKSESVSETVENNEENQPNNSYVIGEQFEDTKTFILTVTDNGNNTVDLLLVGTYELKGDQSFIVSSLPVYGPKVGYIADISSSGWSIPTKEQLNILRNTFTAAQLTTKMSSIYSTTQTPISTTSQMISNDGNIYKYSSNEWIDTAVSGGSYVCLPVISITVNK